MELGTVSLPGKEKKSLDGRSDPMHVPLRDLHWTSVGAALGANLRALRDEQRRLTDRSVEKSVAELAAMARRLPLLADRKASLEFHIHLFEQLKHRLESFQLEEFQSIQFRSPFFEILID